MSDRKTKFMWASIAGADPEPVEVTTLDGRPVVYTLGCNDPFYLDDGARVVRLGGTFSRYGHGPLCMNFKSKEPMERPVLPDADAKKALSDHYAQLRLDKLPRHSWRGPR